MRITITAAMVVVACAPSLAQDRDWDGFYASIYGAGSLYHYDAAYEFNTWDIGAAAGWRTTIAPATSLGFELGYSPGGYRDVAGDATAYSGQTISHLVSARAVLGYDLSFGRFYVAGGPVLANYKIDEGVVGIYRVSAEEMLIGGTLAVGAEVPVTDNLSARIEATGTELHSIDEILVPYSGAVLAEVAEYRFNVNPTVFQVRAGLTYSW